MTGQIRGPVGESADREACGEKCRELLLSWFAALGIEATVTKVPPIVTPAYEPLNMRCPHGELWFAEPTGEQIAAWTAAGVE